MNSDKKTSICIEIERIFQILNLSLFEGKLKPVSVIIQPKKKISLRWMQDLESLVIGADFQNLEYNDILGSLLHEMIHIANHQNDIIDVTTNQYHNKKFLNDALNLGLVVIKHKTQGWAITSTVYPRNVVERIYIKRPLKDNIAKRVAAFDNIVLDKNAFKSAKTEMRERLKFERPTKTFFLKYQCNCPPPHNSIRSGRRPDGPNALNIQCLNCRSEFECVTELED